MKKQEGVVRLYNHLTGLAESGQNTTGWDSVNDICDFLFGAINVRNIEKTKAAVMTARKMLKQTHRKCFYHTENEGYVLLNTADQFMEVIKRHAAIADGFRISAGEVQIIGSSKLPTLNDLLTPKQLKQLHDGTKIFTPIKIKARQKSTA